MKTALTSIFMFFIVFAGQVVCQAVDPDFVVLTMQTFGTPGSGTTSPAGVKLIESLNTPIAIEAMPADGYIFSSWTLKGRGALANASSASTELTMTGNAVVTAIFISATEPMTAKLTVLAAIDGTGTVTPAAPVTIQIGQVQTITSTAAAGCKFVKWSIEGTATIDTPYLPVAKVIVSGPARIAAHFAKDEDVVTVEFKAQDGGTVQDTGTYYIVKGDTRSVNALPSPDYVFTGWLLTGLSELKSEFSPETEITPYENSTLTATFDQFTCTFSHKDRKINIQTSDLSGESGSYVKNRDKVTVKSLPMCIDYVNFDPNTDTLHVVIDGNVFVINKENGLFKRNSTGYSYKSFSRIPQLSLVLDFIKGVWSFWGTNLELESIDNSNGIDVILEANGKFYGRNYNMDESLSWTFSNLKNSASPLDSASVAMADFNLKRASSNIFNNKDLKDRLSIRRAVLQLPDGATVNIAEAEVTLTVGELATCIPRGSFVKGNGNQYNYIDRKQKLQVRIDLAKREWSADISGFNEYGKLNPQKPIKVYLTIGDYQSGQEISPNVRRNLKYDYNKIYWNPNP